MPFLVASSLFCLALAPITAAAQDAPVRPGPDTRFCYLFTVPAAEGRPQELHADCRGRGLTLGLVERYERVVNEGLQATLVDTRTAYGRRIWLISFQDDGQVLLEDISGSIALAAGRGPMSELSDLEIDFGTFAIDGSIKVARDPSAAPGLAGLVSIPERRALELARRAAIPAD